MSFPLSSAAQTGIPRAELLPPTFTNFEFDANTFKLPDPSTMTRYTGSTGQGSTYGLSDPHRTLTGNLFANKMKGVIVTPDATANTFTITNSVPHGLVAGDTVYKFTAGTTLPAGLSLLTPYYVIASGLTTTVFKVSATVGGSAIDISDIGTGTITAFIPCKGLLIKGNSILCKDASGMWYGLWLTITKAEPTGFVQGQPAIFEVEFAYDPAIQAYYTGAGTPVPADIDG